MPAEVPSSGHRMPALDTNFNKLCGLTNDTSSSVSYRGAFTRLKRCIVTIAEEILHCFADASDISAIFPICQRHSVGIHRNHVPTSIERK